MTSASIATFVAKRLPQISSATTKAGTLMFPSNRQTTKKKHCAKKLSKDAPSKPSATTASFRHFAAGSPSPFFFGGTGKKVQAVPFFGKGRVPPGFPALFFPKGRKKKKPVDSDGRKLFFKNCRSRLLEEWRGLPQDAPRPDRAAQIGPTVQALLAGLGLEDRLDDQEIAAAWKDVVGEFLATHSAPVGLKDGTLIVRVLQPTVRYELDRVWKKKILDSLQERFSKTKIRDLRFQL